MSKRIVLSGYYGFDNLGDEAVLQSIIQTLKAEDPDVDILVLSANPAVTAERYGVKAKDRWNFFQVLSALKWADLLISGGGSLLQDVTSQKNIPYYLGVVAMARALKKKVAFYAQGIGPIKGALGRSLTRLIANRVQLITVRDQKSYELLIELGVDRPTMKVTVDPVVLLKPGPLKNNEYRQILELKKKCSISHRPIIGIAPRPWQGLKGYYEALVETGRRLKEKKDAEIILIPMHPEKDLKLCLQIADQLPGARVLKEKYRPDQLLAFYKELDFLIGIRLHALIFAATVHLPHLGITYDPKVNGFLNQIGDEPIADIENVEAEVLYREVVRRLKDKEGQVKRIAKAMASLRKEARENARLVLNLLD
ncbi:polysaccharide pyruvyl transferase CsaB [Anoxybacter fermentans]|uniref:Polysaccharide pyruvyl transferase CsaB n=1 Tax=Anoxybacter fermentans TaxID=1323375 RepID=A0A3Q9HNW6_9FIRM|nr:polysaccharide pyruvyl transferase CsaB [Anoxybacter fermentans]AZR72197.1 polysaccharide pyruvyl transferase CsaB [Anoxybacter fermentans]